MRSATLLVSVFACGCTAAPGTSPDAAVPPDSLLITPDAPPGTHCTAMAPRSVAPTVFVAPTGYQQRMLDTINNAKTSLDIQMYLFTTNKLESAVIAAKNRGVAVRVLLDKDEAGNDSTRTSLQNAGVMTKDDPATFPFAHAKYVIADHASVTIMSANWNDGAMTEERNYGMVDRDPDDLADAQTIFDADWAGTSPSLPCTRLIVSPVNAKPRVLDLINGAQTSLDVEALYVSDATIQNAIIAAAGRGVAVRVILSDPSSTPDNTSTAALFGGKGIPTRVITTFDIHAKLIVADKARALIGSQNFSLTSLTKNREVGAIVFEPGALTAVNTQYDSDWAIATTP
ncbi:MAG TPA: phospholipase D-like domain-containing protein [Kofleriaceae bacterium]|nr:phospholipase D-like domain-containing protein [Kofleriaceae bacterium]